jgi:hypothetical protein
MRSSGRWKKCGKPRATEGNDARRGEVCGANQRLSERVVKRVSAVAACRLGRASKQASQPVDQSINQSSRVPAAIGKWRELQVVVDTF